MNCTENGSQHNGIEFTGTKTLLLWCIHNKEDKD